MCKHACTEILLPACCLTVQYGCLVVSRVAFLSLAVIVQRCDLVYVVLAIWRKCVRVCVPRVASVDIIISYIDRVLAAGNCYWHWWMLVIIIIIIIYRFLERHKSLGYRGTNIRWHITDSWCLLLLLCNELGLLACCCISVLWSMHGCKCFGAWWRGGIILLHKMLVCISACYCNSFTFLRAVREKFAVYFG